MDSRGGYLVTEQDGTKHLPTTKDGSLDRGLCGAAWAALHKGYRGNTYGGPNKAAAIAKLTAIYKAQGWDLPGDGGESGMAAGGDVVYRTGLIFRAGDFPDKGISLSEQDMAAAVAAFAPVDAELEHINTAGIATFLDGKLGRLVGVWQDGPNLYGRLAVPAWLDPLWAEFGRKVSTVWDKATKRLTRIGLVLNPRVEDAAVMSAYAAFAGRHDTPHGQATMQRIHDMAAMSGAICQPQDRAGFVSTHEAGGMQAIHDMAGQHGASCPGMGAAAYSVAPTFAADFAGSRHSRADAQDIQQIHDLAGRQGADCAPSAAPMSTHGRKGMHLDSIAFWKRGGRRFREEARQEGIGTVPDEEVFTLLDDAERDEREKVHTEMEAAFAARIAEAEAREQRANEQLFAATAQRLQGEAAAFADGLIVGNKLLPAEREGLIAALATAGMDDAQHGAITFAVGAQGSRVDQLKAMYSARPAHTLTREQLDGRGNLTVVMGGQPQPTGPDSYDDTTLLNMTPAGRQAAALRKQRA